MGWRDRSAGHAILEEADFAALQDLPKSVAFQVRLFERKKKRVWFIGTRNNLRKWEKNDDPFSEFAPLGSAKFIKKARESATSFYEAFDELCAFEKETFGKGFSIFGPSKSVGELSLGLQIAKLLGKRVFTFIDDDDPLRAMLACIADPEGLVRIRCHKPPFHLLFERGTTTVANMITDEDIQSHSTHNQEGHILPPIDLRPYFERISQIPNVVVGERPADYAGWQKQLVSQELNAFVGYEIAEADSVVPSYRGLKLLAQRAANGKTKIF